MRQLVCVGALVGLLCSSAGPAAAACRAGDRRDAGERGRLVADLQAGCLSFEASNGFRIEGVLRPGGMDVTLSDDLGLESVSFEVEPPRRALRHAELRVHVGGATWIHRVGVDGAPGEVEMFHPDGRHARHADVAGAPLESAGEPEAYLLLRELALDQASQGFWAGVEQLAVELDAAGGHDPTTCFFSCLTCAGSILSYLASIGIVVTCGPALPLCLIALLQHLGLSTVMFAACGSCLTCLDQAEGVQPRGDEDGPVRDIQQ